MMRRGRLGMSTIVLIFHFLRHTKRGLSPDCPDCPIRLSPPIVPL